MSNAPDLAQVAEQDWDIARRRLPVIRQLAEVPCRTRGRVSEAAKMIGCGVTQTYELLARYLARPQVETSRRSFRLQKTCDYDFPDGGVDPIYSSKMSCKTAST
jgi:hypothetical protein